MAELVVGVGLSHSPMLVLDGADWPEWAARDGASLALVDERGEDVAYAARVEAAGDRYRDRVSVDEFRRLRRRTDAALDALAAHLTAAAPDAVIVVGDDQDEHLLEDNRPPLLVYVGGTIRNDGFSSAAAKPEIMRKFLRGFLEPGDSHDYPVATDLALHLVGTMMELGIDVATANRLPRPDRSMGHAFSFPMRRVVPPGVALVPVMLNTYYPPNQPRAKRCVDYGVAVRAAIDTFGARRVGVIASGGLSHFLVLPELDAMVLEAFAAHDLGAVVSIPEPVFRSGTSEIKSWLTVAAACHDLPFGLTDYVPAYRTLAGSGTGLAFATWG